MAFGLKSSIFFVIFALSNFVHSGPYVNEKIFKDNVTTITNQNDSVHMNQNNIPSYGNLDTENDDEYEEEDEELEKYKITYKKSLNDNSKRAFSLFGTVESVFSAMANSLNSIVSSMIGTQSKSSSMRSNRISYRNHQLLRIFPTTDEHISELRELRDSEPDDIKFWNDPILNRTTDVVVGPDIVSDVKEYLKSNKIDFKVLISDIQKTINYQNPKMSKEQRADLVTSQGHTMTWRRYHRYGEILRYLEYLSFRYPTMVEIITIGHSYEGLPIKMAKISTGPKRDGEPKPAIWIDAGMHAREWISIAVATYILSQLVERNSSYSKLLDVTDWMILPVANPDGYEYTHTHDRLWRKTRSYHGDHSARYTPSSLFHLMSHYTRWFWTKCEGVDPNRNFGYQWGERNNGGTSLDPCHETYAGPYAFSEPETKAIAEYIMANRQNIRMYLTLHSYAQMWLSPWAYVRNNPVDYSELTSVARRAVNAIAKVHGTSYQAGPAADLLYPTSGASDDWAKVTAGIKYAYTIELRDRGTYGFLLPATQIVPTGREIWAGIRAIARLVTCNT
ncbi:PREDICTED: carboxypeptidase B-like isoform X1 [Polistes dominula]|uniref:Carboxypeptidase B-like isoform X1 n=1 Tax=Polistes dominula TaxID=743375 RepID=A0ABM1I7R5_POLDO|nr:PREDICTED: carboxypeptidase B-like isoform X1 [Polistes dominula]